MVCIHCGIASLSLRLRGGLLPWESSQYTLSRSSMIFLRDFNELCYVK